MRNLANHRIQMIADSIGSAPSLHEAREMAVLVIDLQKRLLATKEQLDRVSDINLTAAQFLKKTRMSQTEAAQFLSINRNTLHKYLSDINGDRHRIIDDKLMVVTCGVEKT